MRVILNFENVYSKSKHGRTINKYKSNQNKKQLQSGQKTLKEFSRSNVTKI